MRAGVALTHDARAESSRRQRRRLPESVSRAAEKLREVGLRYGVQLALARLIPVGWFRAGRLLVYVLEPEPQAGSRPPRDEGLRWAVPTELELLASFGHSRETLEERLARGDRAFVLVQGAELVGYAWFRSGMYEEDGLGVRFSAPAGDVWLYDAMVGARERGRGHYARLLEGAADALAREGVRRIWVAVETLNRASVEAHSRGGGRAAHRIRLIRLCGVSWLSGEPRARRLWLREWPLVRVGGS